MQSIDWSDQKVVKNPQFILKCSSDVLLVREVGWDFFDFRCIHLNNWAPYPPPRHRPHYPPKSNHLLRNLEHFFKFQIRSPQNTAPPKKNELKLLMENFAIVENSLFYLEVNFSLALLSVLDCGNEASVCVICSDSQTISVICTHQMRSLILLN